VVATAAMPTKAAIVPSERNALIDLYNATQGSQWTNHAGWLGPPGTECYWAGVTCDIGQSTVVSLNLAENNLRGSLTALMPFASITRFDVSKNVLTGPLPILTGLSQLRILDVGSNRLNGTIPDLTGLAALQELRLWGNQFTGPFPLLDKATNLRVFDAQYNKLSGSIPALIQSANLKQLIVSNNQLSGGFPNLSGLSNLQGLDISFNQLTGPIPSLGSNTTLQTLYIDHNNFSGSLPTPPSNLATAVLCPNALLTQTINNVWDMLSRTSPWYQNCAGPAQLAITSINYGVNPAVGAKFAVVVSALDTTGQPISIGNSDVTIRLSLAEGSGQLYSQFQPLNCTIPAGGSTCTVPEVSYSIVEAGIKIQASPPYSNPPSTLRVSPSAPFSVVPGSYTVGGTVSGLNGPGLVLSLNLGSQRLAIEANGSFTFPLGIGDGAYYSVDVLSSPTSPSQKCRVKGAQDYISSNNVTNIQVSCTTQQTVTVAAYAGWVDSSTQTVDTGSTATFRLWGNNGFYPQVSARGCTVSKVSDSYWTTSALNNDCAITAKFVPMQFVALNTARLLDTRVGGITTDGNYAGLGPMSGGTPYGFTILGRGGVPSTGVAAVVLNIAVADPAASGFLTSWPSCSPRPLSSNLNFVAHQTVANLVIVAAGCDAMSNLFSSTGPTDVMVDVVGYFKAGENVSPMRPARLLDTRPGFATVDGSGSGAGALPGGSQINLQVAGRAGIPASGVSAVALNVTVANPSQPGFVTAWPTDQPRPLASNLNFVPGQTVPNLVIAKLSGAGQVSLFNSAGTTDIVADAAAWFPDTSDFTPLTPARLADTREGSRTVDGKFAGGGKIVFDSSGTRCFTVLGRGGIPRYGVSAVVLNVTVANSTTAGSLTVWPSGSAEPQPNLHYAAGQTVPNLVIIKTILPNYLCGPSVVTSAGSTDVIIDAVGWFPGPD